MTRELTLASVAHPQFIENEWMRVDHPTIDPLTQGAPDLGWEGDPRLVIYLHKPTQTFVLWRLEHDGEYRPTAKLPEGQKITPENINRLIANLTRTDVRRGFDPFTDVMKTREAADKAAAQYRHEWVVDFADKFRAALAWSHLPGFSHTRPRFARRSG